MLHSCPPKFSHIRAAHTRTLGYCWCPNTSGQQTRTQSSALLKHHPYSTASSVSLHKHDLYFAVSTKIKNTKDACRFRSIPTHTILGYTAKPTQHASTFVLHVLSIMGYVYSFSQFQSPCTWKTEQYSACNQDVLGQVRCV